MRTFPVAVSVLLLVLILHACNRLERPSPETLKPTAFIEEPSMQVVTVPFEAALDVDTLNVVEATKRALAGREGRPLVLYFWSSWCPPCADDLGHLATLAKTSGSERLAVVTVQLDSRRPVDGRFAPIAAPMVALTDSLVDRHLGGVSALPTAFIILPSGEVAYRHVGRISRGRFGPLIDSLVQR